MGCHVELDHGLEGAATAPIPRFAGQARWPALQKIHNILPMWIHWATDIVSSTILIEA